MVQVKTISGDEFAYNSLLYTPDQNTLDYLQGHLHNAYEKLRGYNDSILNTSREMYERVNSSEAIMKAKQFLHNAQVSIDPNAIYPLYENNIYEANYAMRRYIMVEPTVRKLYEENRCYGYDDQFLDIEPDITYKEIEEHRDYRAVMNGLLRFDDEGYGYYKEYLDAPILDIYDQSAILETWDTVRNMIAEGNDPTAEDEEDNEL